MSSKLGKILVLLTAISGAFAFSGCGGGGGGSRPTAPAPTVVSVATGKISGAVLTQISIDSEKGSEIIQLPLHGVDVICGGSAGKTGDDGRFMLMDARAGKISCAMAKKGYTPEKFEIDFPAGGSFTATATVMVPEFTGIVKITSSENNVAVSLDGITAAALVTGVSVSGVSAGAHTVVVTADGFEPSEAGTINVIKDKTAVINLPLIKKTVSLAIDPGESTMLVGGTRNISAQCAYFDGSEGQCAEMVAWSSSNPAAGTISDTGIFTAVAPGETRISATRLQSKITHPGVTVKVVCPADTSWMDGACAGDSLLSISVSPGAVSLDNGETAELGATCRWRIAGEAPCPELDWVSGDAGIAVVDSAGVLTGVSAGSVAIKAVSGSVFSGPATVTVIETRYPELTCEGAGGFCLDIIGGNAGADGTVEIGVSISNPPAAGIGTGIISISWAPGSLVYQSNSAGDGLVGIGQSREAGKLVFVFTSPTPMTADEVLFTVKFSVAPGADAPALVSIEESLEATNFTDFGLNLITPSGIVFRGGYAGQ